MGLIPWSCLILLSVFVAVANAECTFDIELLVDGKPWSSNRVLYKPVGSNGSFVRCQRCNDSTTKNPRWTSIVQCDENTQMKMICIRKVKSGVWDLQFSSFMQSQARRYACKGNNETKNIMIAVLSHPVITIDPTNQLVNTTSVTLDCEGTGGGPLTYHWETSNINGGQWMIISDSNSKTLVVSNLEQSRQYRCVASNEIGSTTSDVATVTILKIITHPQDKTVAHKSKVNLTCASSVSYNVTFSWTHNGTSISGSSATGNTSILTITSVRYNQAGRYVCTVSSGSLSVMSNTATLTVYGSPNIMQHPVGGDIPKKKNMKAITLMCRASSVGRPTYSWERSSGSSSWTTVSNDNTTSYNTKKTLAIGQYMYRCRVRNDAGSVVSDNAIVNVYGSPAITTHPVPSSDIPVGKSDTLTCIASGLGTLVYSWQRSSGSSSWTTVSNGNKASYNTKKTLAIGQYMYRCRVRNDAGSVVSNKATVNVYGPPTITTHPINQLTNVSMSVTLDCEGSGRGSITYHWETKRGKKWMKIKNSNDKRYVVRNLQQSQQYRCVVSDEAGSNRSNAATVTVLKTTIQPGRTLTAIALEDVTLSCSASVDDVTYSWYRVDGSIPQRSQGKNTNELTIPQAIPRDEGMYYCIAVKEGIRAESNRTILKVDDQLSISVTPTNKTVGEGATAIFTATASGKNKNFTYQWKKRGNENLPSKVSGVNGAVLMIPNSLKSDEGQYYCIVANEWGRSKKSNDVNLTVAAGIPVIKKHPVLQVVNNSEKVTFECLVNGSNNLTVTWERDRNQYTSGRIKNKVHDDGVNSSLTLNKAMVIDSGKYRCRATNVDGKSATSNEAELIIFPRITKDLDNVTVLIGQSVEFVCKAIGTDIGYQWIKDDVVVSGSRSRKLRFTNIQESDEGAYKCRASNNGGMVVSNPATVIVYGPPIIKMKMQRHHVVLGENVHINCTATNDQDAPMNLMFSWMTFNNLHFTITTTDEDDNRTATSTLRLSNVTSNHGGVYMCTVSNGGDQRNNVSVNSTLIIEEQSSPPLNFSIIHINTTSFHLMWSLPEYPHGSINYYKVHYKRNNHDQSEPVVNVFNFTGTYTLDNLTSFTEYSVYVTAVRLIGDNGRPLEGMKATILTKRTLAGKPDVSTELTVDQAKPERIININSTMTSRGRTFDVDLPIITMTYGPFSHFYIIVIINTSAITNVEDITTHQLLEYSMLYYIAAVVNASQYVQYINNFTMRYTLGAGDNTTDRYGHVFHNREIKAGYSFFYRVFSANSTLENEIYTNTKMINVSSPQQSTAEGGSSGSSAIGAVIGVIVALLLIIIVIVVVILLLSYYKKNYLKPKETGLPKFVPVDAGIQLDKKEKIDEDGKPFSSLAATNPLPQETSFSPNSALPLEVITSVGQPTTLFVELPYADDSEITWKKDGKPVNYPVLADGSLYIADTKLSDQGDYTVTAAGTDNTTSENVQLKAVDPRMPTTLSEQHKPIKVEDFPEHIALMQSKKSIRFEEDYESVMIDVDFSQHAAKLHVNASKNRYKNIIPYDHCRVVLSQLDQKPGSDYFNASFVDGYKEPKAYIATQGPVSNTVDDFWRMVWEHNVTTIVMLTRLVEDSKIKCIQYWPESESATYGDFTVTITKHEVIAKYCIRKFIVEKISDHKSREVCQFHFTAWPDHGVPKYGTDILEFHKRIDKYHTRKDNKPMLVHCSAGVGRTGTFIAIDVEIQRIDHESLVDVHNTVCRLRFWRNFMVQTVEQYALIFTALLEHIACGDTSIAAPTSSVQEKVKELSTVDPHTDKTGFEIQFETLTKNSPKEKEFSYSVAASSKNKSKNRNKKCLPPDASRVHLSKTGNNSDYINACYIDGYRHCKEFLVGPGPMESTSADFWRMIWEHQSHAIVMLGQLKENGEEASFKYWPNKGDHCDYDKLAVETTSEDLIDSSVTKRIMKVTHKETSATKTITQLQYIEWSPNSCPSNPNSIIEMIEILERVQRKTANGPITVHCSDGIGRSGAFCALVASMNRLKAEQMVDVFKTIITMRTQRPGLVANAEQFKFIHEALIAMLMCYATYANFSGDNITVDSAVYENLPSTSM